MLSGVIYYPFQSATTRHAVARPLDLHAITILTAREVKIVHGNSDVSTRLSLGMNVNVRQTN